MFLLQETQLRKAHLQRVQRANRQIRQLLQKNQQPSQRLLSHCAVLMVNLKALQGKEAANVASIVQEEVPTSK